MKPPDKRCGCNTTAAETSVLAIDADMLSECVGCGAVWSLNDGTPPDYVAWLLKTHFENGAGTVEWTAKFALAGGPEQAPATPARQDEGGAP